jgi:hypothetical protein
MGTDSQVRGIISSPPAWLPFPGRVDPDFHKLGDRHGARRDFRLMTAPFLDRRDLRRAQPDCNWRPGGRAAVFDIAS